MTIPAYSPHAFMMRVSMARRIGLFIIVEGVRVEKWFYDEICQRSDKIVAAGYKIFDVEFVTRGLNPAGGKSRVLRLFDEVAQQGEFSQESQKQSATMMFCVDSDFDRIVGKVRRSRHLTYTWLPDVEAHLFDDFNAVEFIRRCHSAPKDDAEVIASQLANWKQHIAEEWRLWFEMCLTAHYCGMNSPVFGTPPRTLGPGCQVDTSTISGLKSKIISKYGKELFHLNSSRAKARLDTIYASNKHAMLLKGKWLSSQLRYESNTCAESQGFPKVNHSDSVLEAVKGSANFGLKTTRYYTRRFEALID